MSSNVGERAPEASGANLLFKGVRILDLVAELGPRARLTEIAAASRMPTATVHRILLALEKAELLRRDLVTREYRLGPKLIHLARRALEDFDVGTAAQNEMQRLADNPQYTVLLAVFSGDTVVTINRLDSRHPIALHAVGQQVPLHASALGKAVLSALPHSEQLRLIENAALSDFTAATITDAETLRGHLEYTTNRSYAIDDAEMMMGVTGVAAPIRNELGHPIGAIGVYAPATALDSTQAEALGQDLAETAMRISGMMGMNPPEPWTSRKILLARDNEVTAAIASDAGLGASPVWLARERRLAWVDITRRAILSGAPGEASVSAIDLPEVPASIVANGDRFLAMVPRGVIDVSRTGAKPRLLAEMPAAVPHMRFNSSKCDSRGRLWVTTQDVSISRPVGQLYRVDADGSFRAMAGGFLIPIGLGWSPDNRYLYLCDAPRREIYSWKFDAESGEISERRIFARVPEGSGRPAGLAVDIEGFVWNVQADGWSVTRYDPDGRIERIIALPVPKPIDCCFGSDDMQTLFVTTGRLGLPERRLHEVPWSGSILALRCPVPGTPAFDYLAPTP